MSFAKPTDVQITKYAEHFVIYGKKTPAIRNAFPESKASDQVLSNKAVEFHKLGEVQVKIEQLHKAINDSHNESALYTAQQAIAELEEARELAKIPNATGQAQTAAMVAASMGKSKIAGLLVEKVHTEDITPPKVEYVIPDADSTD